MHRSATTSTKREIMAQRWHPQKHLHPLLQGPIFCIVLIIALNTSTYMCRLCVGPNGCKARLVTSSGEELARRKVLRSAVTSIKRGIRAQRWHPKREELARRKVLRSAATSTKREIRAQRWHPQDPLCIRRVAGPRLPLPACRPALAAASNSARLQKTT